MNNVCETTLENCFELLSEQYSDLCQIANAHNEKKENSKQYAINGIGVDLLVHMMREDIKRDMQKGVTFCGGKMCKDTVYVTVNEGDNEFIQKISDYFLNQKNPPMFVHATNKFDAIIINGKLLR